VFSVDLEDWYQGLEIDMDQWGRYPARIETGLEVLLELLDQAGVRATFFVLGWQAERTPHLVPRLAAMGHEIASHGYSHRFVYQQGPEQFRAELRRSKRILEDQARAPVLGYRAPFFSITQDALWALDILAEEGIVYDSSVFPTHNYRYGIPEAVRQPSWIRTPSGLRVFEVPLSTVRVPGPASALGVNLPLGGGGYFRLYPYSLTRALGRRLLQHENHGLVFYVRSPGSRTTTGWIPPRRRRGTCWRTSRSCPCARRSPTSSRAQACSLCASRSSPRKTPSTSRGSWTCYWRSAATWWTWRSCPASCRPAGR
jgi:polysaccharide deacetylase family protein (PEP-CTERM system associated)